MNNLLYKLQQMIADLAKAEEAVSLDNNASDNDNLDRAGEVCGQATSQASTIPGCECNVISPGFKPTSCKDNTGKELDCTKVTDALGCFPLSNCALPNPPAACPTITTPTTSVCPTDLTAAAKVVGCECIADPISEKCKDVDCKTTTTADGCTPIDCKVKPDYYGCKDTGTTDPTTESGSCTTNSSCTVDSGCKFMFVDKECKYGEFDLLAYIKSNSSTILNLDLTSLNFTDIDLTLNETIVILQGKIDELNARLDGCCGATGSTGGCEYISYDGVFVDIQPANIKVQRGEVDATTGNCTIPEYEGPANDNSVRFLLSPDSETGAYKIEQVASLGEI